jgi:transcriptional regulator with XRE-family HTH domain
MLLMTHTFLDLVSMGKAFKLERKALGLTQVEVAKKAGLRRETIIQIESGEMHCNYRSPIGLRFTWKDFQ